MRRNIQILRGIVQGVFMVMLMAGLYFGFRKNFRYVMYLSLVAGNFFCGWICPYGTIQEIFGRLGDRIFKKKYRTPYGIQRYLQFSRYIIYGLLTIEGVKAVLSPYDSYKVFVMSAGRFPDVSLSIAVIIMVSFIVISMIFERPFCNYFCPESYRYAVRSLVRPVTIKREEGICIDCKACDRSCPMNIEISKGKNLRSLQCINCFRCIGSCPVKGALTYGTVFSKKSIAATQGE